MDVKLLNAIIIGVYAVSFMATMIEQRKRENIAWKDYKGSASALIGGLVLGVVMAISEALNPKNENAIYYVNGVEVGRGSTNWLDIGSTFLGTVFVIGGSLLFFSWITAGILAKEKSPERTPSLLAAFALIGTVVMVVMMVVFLMDEAVSILEYIILFIISMAVCFSGVGSVKIAKKNGVTVSMFLVMASCMPIVMSLTVLGLLIWFHVDQVTF